MYKLVSVIAVHIYVRPPSHPIVKTLTGMFANNEVSDQSAHWKNFNFNKTKRKEPRYFNIFAIDVQTDLGLCCSYAVRPSYVVTSTKESSALSSHLFYVP